jgi:hypothetical protein
VGPTQPSSEDRRNRAGRSGPAWLRWAEIRPVTRRAGLDPPGELMQQFKKAWPSFEAMAQRILRRLGFEAEPAHSYPPIRFVDA